MLIVQMRGAELGVVSPSPRARELLAEMQGGGQGQKKMYRDGFTKGFPFSVIIHK